MSALLSSYQRNAAVKEVREKRTIDPVSGHRPPTDRRHTRCNNNKHNKHNNNNNNNSKINNNNNNNNNLIQVSTVSRDSAVIVDRSKFGLINNRYLRNKSLFVRNYVDECSLDIVVLTETWLTKEDTTSVSNFRR